MVIRSSRRKIKKRQQANLVAHANAWKKRPWEKLKGGKIEPRVDDLMNCEVLRTMMASDHVKPEEFAALVKEVRDHMPK